MDIRIAPTLLDIYRLPWIFVPNFLCLLLFISYSCASSYPYSIPCSFACAHCAIVLIALSCAHYAVLCAHCAVLPVLFPTCMGPRPRGGWWNGARHVYISRWTDSALDRVRHPHIHRVYQFICINTIDELDPKVLQQLLKVHNGFVTDRLFLVQSPEILPSRTEI